jgi:hypothetical protein
VDTAHGGIEIQLAQEGIEQGDDVVMIVRPESVTLSLDSVGERRNVLYGTLETYMYAGSLAKCTVSVGTGTMIIDQYNPRDARHFQHAGRVAIEIPRSVHLLKR